MRIHPTAVVDPGARIAGDVEIGPYSVLGQDVVLGPGCVVENHVTITGRTTLGANCHIHSSAVIGGIPQDLKYGGEDTELMIGEGNTIREFVTINIGTAGGGGKTVIGDGNLLMAYVHVAHDCVLGSHTVLANAVTLGGHVRVEDGAKISGLAAVHHFVTIGRLAFVGGCTKVVRDVPPFVMVDGNPARVHGLNIEGLRRAGTGRGEIRRLKEAYRHLFRSGLNRSRAIEDLRARGSDDSPAVAELIRFLLDSERGRRGRGREAERTDLPAGPASEKEDAGSQRAEGPSTSEGESPASEEPVAREPGTTRTEPAGPTSGCSRDGGAVYRHVLCLYPYRVELDRSGWWPPLGLEIVAAALEPFAGAIDVVDLRREAGHTTDFIRPDTDLVCFSVNWEREVDFVRDEIRSVPSRVLTIVGGRHATEVPEDWLCDCPNVDILVRGDGEGIVKEIAQGLPLDRITGISYRQNGEIVHGPVRHVGPVTDHIWPNRRLRRYVYSVAPYGCGTSMTFDSVASSRGCPYDCTFCSFNRRPWGEKRGWSARSPESVVRELEEIDADIVAFVDDNFMHDMDRVAAICDLIVERGLRGTYGAQGRAEVGERPEVVRKMERAGFAALWLGIESARDGTLRSMGKGFDTRKLREYFRVLRESSMILQGFFLLGNIGETEEDMLAIVPFARELGLDNIVLTSLRCDQYSSLAEQIARAPGHYVAPGGAVYSDRYPRQHIRRIRRKIIRDFYTPRQVLRVLRKARRNGLVTPGSVVGLPWLAARIALERWRRKRASR